MASVRFHIQKNVRRRFDEPFIRHVPTKFVGVRCDTEEGIVSEMRVSSTQWCGNYAKACI
jgi:hypothetical protein|tara:strand:- start:259 stop:438 length:180 start_codon:yes stop_codon:yes gene_type:complete